MKTAFVKFLICMMLIVPVAHSASVKLERDYVDYCSDASVVLCARMNENPHEKVNDDAHNLSTGIVVGGSYQTECKEGGCHDFVPASNTRVDFGDITDLDGATELTVMAWIKMDSLIAGNRIMSKWGGSSGEKTFLFTIPGSAEDELRLIVFDGTDTNSRTTTASNLTTATWYHVVATFTATNTTKIYVNGVDQTISADSDTVSSLQNGTENLQIGHETDSSEDGIDGLIDEVAIFTRALTPTEVLDIYENGLK